MTFESSSVDMIKNYGYLFEIKREMLENRQEIFKNTVMQVAWEILHRTICFTAELENRPYRP